MRASRRQFIGHLAGAGGSVVLRTSGAGVLTEVGANHSSPASGAQQGTFRGARPGEEREVEGMRLCWCPPGRFRMGSPPTERGHRPDEAQVEVTLTRGFWTARTEVTQRQWQRVAGRFPDRLPSADFGEGDEFPVYWINFHEAEAFCAALTRTGRRSGTLPPGWEFTLPTEAQWEYACRAGTVTATSFGESIGAHQANVGIGSSDRAVRRRGSARPVGSYPANPWGLHDMHGNVWEWCRDYYHAALPGGTDPDLYESKGLPNRDGTYSRVRRGGAWIEAESFCRSATRLRYESPRRSDHIGFRVFVVER